MHPAELDFAALCVRLVFDNARSRSHIVRETAAARGLVRKLIRGLA